MCLKRMYFILVSVLFTLALYSQGQFPSIEDGNLTFRSEDGHILLRSPISANNRETVSLLSRINYGSELDPLNYVTYDYDDWGNVSYLRSYYFQGEDYGTILSNWMHDEYDMLGKIITHETNSLVDLDGNDETNFTTYYYHAETTNIDSTTTYMHVSSPGMDIMKKVDYSYNEDS